MNDNLDAWHKAYESRSYYAHRLAAAYVEGDKGEVERFAALYKQADDVMERLDKELGDKK